MDELAIILSALALFVATAAFWWNSLRPYRLSVTTSGPRFTLYKVTPEVSGVANGRSWWIPSIDMTVSLTNTGRRSGVVRNLSLMAALDDGRRKEMAFRATFIVDYAEYERVRHNRWQWLERAPKEEWYPVVLGPDSSIVRHVVFESIRWDVPVEGTLTAELYVASEGVDDECEPWKWQIDESWFEDDDTMSLGLPDDVRIITLLGNDWLSRWEKLAGRARRRIGWAANQAANRLRKRSQTG